MPADSTWDGFFVFGVPLHGMMCFAAGGLVSNVVGRLPNENQGKIASVIRRQLMPVYILHAVVIVSAGWVAKALGRFGVLSTIQGNVVMWFVGVIGAVAIGEIMRRRKPDTARILFGGR